MLKAKDNFSYATLEVILIILLIAVWLGVTLPRFGAGDILNKYRLKTAVYNVTADIRDARNLAITNARLYIVKFDFAQNEYRTYQWSISPSNQVGETKTIPSSVTGSGTGEYTFTSIGEADWPGGTGQTVFSISSGELWTITLIRATGTARIQKP